MNIRILALASSIAALVMAGAAPVQAGAGGFKHASGKSIYIRCTGRDCSVTHYDKAGKTTKVDRSAGGRDNFDKLVKSFRAKGYK